MHPSPDDPADRDPRADRAPAALSRSRRWAALAVLSASLLVITMDMTILNIAIPEMSEALHPSADQLLWIVDVYSLVLAGLLIPFTALADRLGRRRTLMLGYAIFGLGSLLVLWTTSPEAVIALRALLGIGGAMIMPTTLSLIRVIFTDPRERATALGIWAAVSGLGAAGGPLIGGVLLEHFAWQAAFLVNVPLMAAGVIAGVLILPESRVSNPGRLDWPAALLALSGMTLFVWAVKDFGAAASAARPVTWIALLLSAGLLAWFARRCLRVPFPLIELRLFRNRPFSAGIIAALGSTFALGAALLLLAQWMQLVDGASPVEAGLRLFPVAISGAAASLAAPLLARWIGARSVLAGGVGCAGLGMIAIGLQPGTLAVGTVLVALVLIGAGTGSLAIGSALIMHGTAERQAGSAAALEETAYELGTVLGVAILGSLASLLYRLELSRSPALAALDPASAEPARESLGSAVSIAAEQATPELARDAGVAFTHSMQAAGIAGGVVMLAAAVLVFTLTPRGTNVSEDPAPPQLPPADAGGTPR